MGLYFGETIFFQDYRYKHKCIYVFIYASFLVSVVLKLFVMHFLYFRYLISDCLNTILNPLILIVYIRHRTVQRIIHHLNTISFKIYVIIDNWS